MTQKENPSSKPQEQGDNLRQYPFLQKAEDVRKALNVDEDPKRWEEFLASIVTLTTPPEGKYTLADTYIELDDRRVKIAQALNLLMGFLEKKEAPPEDLISALRRNLPKYFVDQSFYHQQLDGITKLRPPLIPKDLAEYVPLGEEEKFARMFANVILPTQYDVRDKAGIPENISPQMLSLFINEVVLHAGIHRTRMSDVLPYLQARPEEKAVKLESLREALGFSSWTKESEYAAMLLVKYIEKHQVDIETYGTTVLGKSLDKLTVAEALNATVHMSPAGELAELLSKNAVEIAKGNFSVVSANIREYVAKGSSYAEEAVQTALAPLSGLNTNSTDIERDNFCKDVRGVIAFFLTNAKATGSVRYAEKYITDLKGPEQKYVRAIVESVVGDAEREQTIKRLKQSLLLPDPPAEDDEEAARISRVIHELIMNKKITLRDTFQIYYFSTVSKGGNIPLAFSTLHFMDERGQEWRTSIDAEARLFRDYVDLALHGDNFEKLGETAQEIGLKPGSPEMVEFSNLARFLGERGLGEFSHWRYRVFAHIRKFPEFYITTGAATGAAALAGGGVLVYRGYVSWSLSKFSEIADMTDDQLMEMCKDNQEKFKRARLCRNEALHLKTRYSITQARFPRFREINTPTKVKDWWFRRGQRRETGRLIAKTIDEGTLELPKILSVLKREHPNINVLMDMAEEMGEELPDIRNALGEIGFKPQEIADAVKTRGIKKFTGQAQEIMEKIKRMEGIVDDPAKRRRALALIEEAADSFRDDFNAFATEFPDARKTLAKSLAEPGTELSEAFLEAMEKAHVQKRFPQKVGIFFDAPITNEERKLAGRFLRLGLAGESEVLKVPRTIGELRDGIKAATNSNDALALVKRFYHSAEAFNPHDLRALLNEKDVRGIIGANEAIKVERAANRAANQLTKAKLWKGAGVVSGAGLIAFGVIVDGILIHQTNLAIADAEKRGDSAQAELLRSKRLSLSGDAAFGLGTGSLGMAGILTGPPGWVALGGLMAKSASSEYLYNYAEDLNKTELKEFLKRTPEELIALLHGKGNWMIDAKITRERRYELGLDAYILNTQTLAFTPLDDRYMKEVIFELPAWQDKNPYDPEVRALAEKVVMGEKTAKFRISVAQFLRETGGFESPSPRRLELATAYANLKYLERRANDLGDPTILHDTLYTLGSYIPPEGIAKVEPADILDDLREHRAARVLDEAKASSLFSTISMLRTLVEEGEMPKEVARAEFLNAFSASLLAHDGNLFLKDIAETSVKQRFLHEQTLNQILFYEVGPLFDKAINSPEAFAKKALALRDSIRTFLAAGKAFTLEDLDTGSTSFGPTMPPKWYRNNALGIVRGS